VGCGVLSMGFKNPRPPLHLHPTLQQQQENVFPASTEPDVSHIIEYELLYSNRYGSKVVKIGMVVENSPEGQLPGPDHSRPDCTNARD
jgi:hypothetical protein